MDVLASLDPEQRQVAEAMRGPVCVLAGAGTGKTRAITHRIAYQVHEGVSSPSHILAVTFTTRAAGELRSRLRGLGVDGVQARTFHSAALRQLQYFWPRLSQGARPTLLDSKLPAVRAAAAARRLSLTVAEARDVAAELEWAKAALVTPENYAAAALAAGRSTPLAVTTIEAIYTGYEQVNSSRGQIDFEDLLLLTAGAIESRADIADEVRDRYRQFVVDEYQDVSPLQQRLLDAWLGDRSDVCVVGDPNQTIYTFTGATPDYLLRFPSRFEGARIVRLVRDYRSTAQVVALANRFTPGTVLIAQGGDGPEPVITGYDDEPAEAAAAAATMVKLHGQGVAWSQMAALFRVNAQSEVYEAAFATAGVPYQLRGGERFFQRAEVREAVTLLRGALRSAGDDSGAGLVEIVSDVLASRGLTSEPPAGGGAARDRWDALKALVSLAEDMVQADPAANLQSLCDELAARADAQHPPTVEGVTLASLHAAKGLEWDAVFLVGLADGTLPTNHAITPEQLDEERRLLYVGVTRARKHLYLSWAAARAAGGQRRRNACRFLVQAGLVEPFGGVGKSAKPKSAKLDLDDPTIARLKDWRTDKANEAGVPAYVVFDNKTLTAIAEAAPSTLAELGAVPGIGPKKLEDYGDELLRLLE